MRGNRDNVTFWTPMSEKDTLLRSWMLIDWHQNGRIVACAGLGTEYPLEKTVGQRLLRKAPLRTWIRERLSENTDRNWLVPMGGAWWLIIPTLYLATGYLLCVRLPAPSAVVGRLVDMGMSEELAVYPGEPFEESDVNLDFMIRPCQNTIWAAMACLPHEVEQGRELCRMLHAISTWTDTKLHHSVTAELFENAVGDGVDAYLFCAMMLLIMSALARAEAGALTVLPEESEEGTRFSFKASSLQEGFLLPTCTELAACRALADRGCLLFDATQRGKTFRGHLCVTRKDFALLGIKTENEFVDERYM